MKSRGLGLRRSFRLVICKNYNSDFNEFPEKYFFVKIEVHILHKNCFRSFHDFFFKYFWRFSTSIWRFIFSFLLCFREQFTNSKFPQNIPDFYLILASKFKFTFFHEIANWNIQTTFRQFSRFFCFLFVSFFCEFSLNF